MDRITKSLLDEFVNENEFQSSVEEFKLFEHFTAFLSISSHYYESFDTDDVVVGGGGDTSIDAVAIIVNNVIVTEIEEFYDIDSESDSLDVVIIFVQAERSSSFDASKIGDFGYGVKDFFIELHKLPRNDFIEKKAKIVDEIFKKSGKFRKGKPTCFLYYITTGRWTGDENLTARKESSVVDLNDLNLFKSVSFDCFGADDIQRLYQAQKNAISVDINFTVKTPFPEILGIQQAYIGLLAATEFLKIIEDENGEIIDSLFYDNVRHWQEWNDVNEKIKATINDAKCKMIFPLMNNGVTIVAKKIIAMGNKYTLDDFQIVNGCQTSYVLHETRAQLTDQIMIPVRIIEVDDADVKNKIIEATNRQTPVTDEQLFAVTAFPRKIELFFNTFTADNQRIYYERRTRQFNAISSIEKSRIVTPTILIRSFVSMFNEYPHRTTRRYKSLLKNVGIDFFNKDHKLEMYYVAAFSHYRLESLFRSGGLNKNLKIARYHLLMAFRILSGGPQLPLFNSHAMEKYCKKIMEILWNGSKTKEIFQNAGKIISTLARNNLDGDTIRIEPFTKKLIRKLK